MNTEQNKTFVSLSSLQAISRGDPDRMLKYLKQFKEANFHSQYIISCEIPNKKKAYSIAINTALEAEDNEVALKYCGNVFDAEEV